MKNNVRFGQAFVTLITDKNTSVQCTAVYRLYMICVKCTLVMGIGHDTYQGGRTNHISGPSVTTHFLGHIVYSVSGYKTYKKLATVLILTIAAISGLSLRMFSGKVRNGDYTYVS